MTTNFTRLNPNTPLVWLHPDVAFHVEVSRYISAVTIGVRLYYLFDGCWRL